MNLVERWPVMLKTALAAAFAASSSVCACMYKCICKCLANDCVCVYCRHRLMNLSNLPQFWVLGLLWSHVKCQLICSEWRDIQNIITTVLCSRFSEPCPAYSPSKHLVLALLWSLRKMIGMVIDSTQTTPTTHPDTILRISSAMPINYLAITQPLPSLVPGLPMFSMHARKIGKAWSICDVMVTYLLPFLPQSIEKVEDNQNTTKSTRPSRFFSRVLKT